MLISKQGCYVCPRCLPQDGKGFALASWRLAFLRICLVSLRELDSRPTGQLCNMFRSPRPLECIVACEAQTVWRVIDHLPGAGGTTQSYSF